MLKHLRARTPLIAGILLFALALFGGVHWGLYDRFAHLDKAFHVIGGILVGWFAVSLLQRDVVRLAGWKQIVIIVAIASFVGTLWEFAEYLSNFTQHISSLWYRYFHGGDFADTLGDILADIIGGLVFALWVLRKERD